MTLLRSTAERIHKLAQPSESARAELVVTHRTVRGSDHQYKPMRLATVLFRENEPDKVVLNRPAT
jgi:hypothetical protein